MGSTMQKPALVAARTTPKGKAILYWIVTALFCLQMSFTAYPQEQAEAPAGEQQAAKPKAQSLPNRKSSRFLRRACRFPRSCAGCTAR